MQNNTSNICKLCHSNSEKLLGVRKEDSRLSFPTDVSIHGNPFQYYVHQAEKTGKLPSKRGCFKIKQFLAKSSLKEEEHISGERSATVNAQILR